MPLTLEIARFRVHEGAEDQMLTERPAMVEAIRRHFPAHRDAYLCKLDDGTWVDVVVWENRAEAEAAAEGVYAHPELASWFRHTKDVLGFEYAEIHQTAPAPRA